MKVLRVDSWCSPTSLSHFQHTSPLSNNWSHMHPVTQYTKCDDYIWTMWMENGGLARKFDRKCVLCFLAAATTYTVLTMLFQQCMLYINVITHELSSLTCHGLVNSTYFSATPDCYYTSCCVLFLSDFCSLNGSIPCMRAWCCLQNVLFLVQLFVFSLDGSSTYILSGWNVLRYNLARNSSAHS